MNARNLHVNRSQTSHSYRANDRTSDALSRLTLAYVEADHLGAWLRSPGAHPLAIISFTRSECPTAPCPTMSLDLPQLNKPAMVEVWNSDQSVETHLVEHGSLAISANVLAGCLSFEERPGATLDITAESAYRQLLRLLQDFDFPYLWRVWNFFPRINDHLNGLERYRQFCVGRHHALAEVLCDFPSSLPAGTAVGTGSGPLQIYFLAGAHPAATHLGNPRQINAYEYPDEYGPRSPSFARATFTRSEHHAHLYIAGTASVVGHTSRHAGLPAEQTRETIRNLRALVGHAEGAAGMHFTGEGSAALYKVYVRNASHLAQIREVLTESPLSSAQVLFLHGELCRQELLVEIEGVISAD